MRIEIEKVGRIAKGQISTNGLTLFIGQNDSGKTYTAATLWAFLKHVDDAAKKASGSLIERLKEFILRLQSGKEPNFTFNISPEESAQIKAQVDGAFSNDIGEILKGAIGYDGFSESKVNVFVEHEAVEFHFDVKKYEDVREIPVDPDDEDDDGAVEAYEVVEYYDIKCTIRIGEFVDDAFSVESWETSYGFDAIENIISRIIYGVATCGRDWLDMRNVIYLPAARTGIMLALDYFVSGVLDRSRLRGKDLDETGSLPAPIQEFARALSRPTFAIRASTSGGGILKNLIQGKFSRKRRLNGADLLYSVDGTDTEIPLASTSSLVTELSALSFLSHRVSKRSLLIFEEPEAHLHLGAQREMARALTKLVNSGVRILVTTHSDTFVQQINNLVSLHFLKDDAELLTRISADPDCAIDPEKISAFDFECVDGRTKINQVNVSNRGIVARSLNKVLIDLATETLEIGDALDSMEDNI